MTTLFARAPLPVLALLVLSACAGAETGAGDPLDDAAPAPSMAGATAPAGGGEPVDGESPPDPLPVEIASEREEEAARRGSEGAPAAGDGAAPAPVRIPDRRPSFDRPEHVRGIYLNKWAAGSPARLEKLVDLARRTEVNSFVIDLKDATGYLSYASGVPLAREIGATGDVSIRDLPGLLRRLSDEGIWPIARIVIVKDPLLAAARPDLAVQDTAGGPWVDRNGSTWLNPWSPEVRDYHLELAREAAALGFPEIQWDYVRFADAPLEDLLRAHYPGRDGREKAEGIRDFLEASAALMEELGVVHTADVFGVTTSARDVGIGQIWERFIDRLDVALPMVYPSHYYRGSFGFQHPNAHPYEIVREALKPGLARSEAVEGAGTIRPWLQDFTMGEPSYGAPEVLAQIQAAYDVGVREWLLWNPGSRYTEEALMPVGGWVEEPLVRVADRHSSTSSSRSAS
ncbi:MAG: putative glycoside hydrolase [Gemmatimonadetes bacterium]|nr:putative glycoside hydrolase [Gemmatimonadota bacterium]